MAGHTPAEDSGAGHRLATALVVVAASAGGLKAVSELLSALPPDFLAAVALVQHLAPGHRSLMPEILMRRTALAVKQAEQGERILEGVVYTAPPDLHLLVDPDETFSLSRAGLVHFVRPSADLLFESAAATFRDRAIGVVLTGTGSDGAQGTVALHQMGGVVIAQDEETSEFFGMPSAAIRSGHVDRVLPIGAIAPALIELVAKGAAP